MSQGIRLRVWLLGLSPFVVLAAILALVFAQRGAPRATSALASSTPEREALPSGAALVVPPPPLPVPSPSSASPQPTMAVAAASSASVSPDAVELGPIGDPPEPLPEIDALLRPPPPESKDWSPEQKEAYRRKVFDDVDARERTLERELAAARRSGDRVTADRKSATLSYLRAKRDAIQRLMTRVAEPDSGS